MFEKFWTMFIVFLVIAAVITQLGVGGGTKIISMNQAHAFDSNFGSFGGNSYK